jgi:hypothetical protein
MDESADESITIIKLIRTIIGRRAATYNKCGNKALTFVQARDDSDQDSRSVNAGTVLAMGGHLKDHKCQPQDSADLDQNTANPCPYMDLLVRS